PAEEIRGGFHHADLLCHRNGNPLIERNAVLLRQPLGRALDRGGQFQRIRAFAHVLILLSTSAGRSSRIPKRPAAASKSRTLCVTNASARPLIATSNTISSAGSRTCGRRR